MVVIVEHFLLLLKILIENTVEDVPMEVIRGLRVKATLIENFNEIKAAGSKYIKPDENKGIKEAKTHLSDKGLFEIMESIKDKDGVHLKNLFQENMGIKMRSKSKAKRGKNELPDLT